MNPNKTAYSEYIKEDTNNDEGIEHMFVELY